MPLYVVVTPLRRGDPDPVPPGQPVELDADDGDALVLLGALLPAPDPQPEPPPPPAPPAPPAAAAPAAPAGPKPLDRQNRTELLATAAAEGVEVAADASKAIVKAAILAKRGSAA